jgi:hypothetical protein
MVLSSFTVTFSDLALQIVAGALAAAFLVPSDSVVVMFCRPLRRLAFARSPLP